MKNKLSPIRQSLACLLSLGGFPLLASCTFGSANTFIFTADLPPDFVYVAAVYYVPDKGETCTVARDDNKAPVFNYKWRESYKPDSEIAIYRTRKGCRLVIKHIDLELYAKYGKSLRDFGSDKAGVGIRYEVEEQYRRTFNEAGINEFYGQCQWAFRTMGKPRILRKLLGCKGMDAEGTLSRYRPVAIFSPDQLAGKTVRMKIKLADEERPSIRDTWVKVPGGWKRCMGKSFEDQYAFCYGNHTNFSTFQMVDGRQCTIYPGCTE